MFLRMVFGSGRIDRTIAGTKMMSIGINIHCYSKELPIHKQIKLMKENGFTATFCMADIYDLDNIISKVQKEGIVFETLHAPLAGINKMWNEDKSGDEMLEKLLAVVQKCSQYQIPVLVVHLSAGRPAPHINDIGNARYDKLMDYARRYGVKIAYENSRAIGNLGTALERYEDAYFCWDVGHENCFTKGMHFMPYFADRVAAIHLHDNMCKLDEDMHLLPFDGLINMQRVASELVKSSYRGSIMLEVKRRDEKYKYKDLSPSQFYQRAADAARRFEEMVNEELRNY